MLRHAVEGEREIYINILLYKGGGGDFSFFFFF